jgi:hypothetical protein
MHRLLLIILAFSVTHIACGKDNPLPCPGGSVESDSEVCDCPADTTWVEATERCETRDSSPVALADGGGLDGATAELDGRVRSPDAGGAPPPPTGIDASTAGGGGSMQADAAADPDPSPPGPVTTPPPPPPSQAPTVASTPSCVAAAETCDGRDNDCDGQVDEGVTNACGGCDPIAIPPGARCQMPAQSGCRKTGMIFCREHRAVCEQPTPMEHPFFSGEFCGNGTDDDCNGQVDEGCGCFKCSGSEAKFIYLSIANWDLTCQPTTGCKYDRL